MIPTALRQSGARTEQAEAEIARLRAMLQAQANQD